MSVLGLSIAFETTVYDPHEKLGLIFIGNIADGEGDVWVSFDKLAKFACCSIEEARDILWGLHSLQHIRVIPRTLYPDDETDGEDVIFVELAARTKPPPRTRQDPIPYSVRRLVYERDGYDCRYCGVTTDEETRSLDHIIPQSKGGNHEPDNLTVCCRSCNSSKGARTVEEWQGARQ